ncbi:hypothetical protein [Nocardia brevicatena]|uniref:hypothetical protein n=1 Tax=Nocardia brevicatena TaxID=37327 RepID=UPI0012FA45EF|nr:hypothetical protein [Nocardia brevicatena]
MCRTEADGLCATWCLLRHHLIAIVAVENASDASSVVCFGPGSYPDLVQARELHPELARLWDAVRHEFWGKLFPPRRLDAEERVWA